jgi:hypothetical protein
MPIKIGALDVSKIMYGSIEITKVMYGSEQIYPESAPPDDPKIVLVQSLGGVLYYNALKADGSGLPSNSPFTSTWVDLLNAYNATLNGFAETPSSGWDISNPSSPFLFEDGSDDYMLTGLTPAIFPANSFSLYARIIPKSSGGAGRVFFAFDQNNAQPGCTLGYDADNLIDFRLRRDSATISYVATANGAFTEDVEITVCGVYNASDNSVKLYIDGALQTITDNLSGTRAIPTSNLYFGVGRYNYANSAPYIGGIRTGVVFNTALSGENIASLISAGV